MCRVKINFILLSDNFSFIVHKGWHFRNVLGERFIRSAESSSDSDEIDDQPKSKKRKADRLDKLISSVNSIKSSIEDINLHTEDIKSKLPIGLQRALKGTSNVESVTHNLCNHQLW